MKLSQRGQTTVEYLLMLFISVAIFVTMVKLMRPVFSRMASRYGDLIEKNLFSQGSLHRQFNLGK